MICRLLCLSLALAAAGSPPASAQVVAHIGETTLTIPEYEARALVLLESGYQHLQTMDMAARRQLMDGIIAQELFILEGLRQGIADDPVIAADLARHERRALMNALYDTRALTGDYTSSDDELRAYFKEQQYDVEVLSRHIVCVTEAEARIVFDELQAGASFDSLFAIYTLPSIQSRYGPSGWVGWFRVGALYPELKAPMSAASVGEFLEPVKTDLGYHVVGLQARRPVPFESSREFVSEKLRVQKRANDMETYVNKLRDRYDIQIDPVGFRMVSELAPGAMFFDDSQTLVRWQGGQLSVADYMKIVQAGRARHPATKDDEALRKSIDNHAGQNVMMAEARRLGLDKDLAVRQKFEGRRREIFSKWLFQHETKRRVQIDTSAASIRQFYEANLDLYTRDDGQVTELSVVESSISSSMLRHAQSKAMDQFIAEMRQRYADQIHVDDAVLARTFPDGLPTSASSQ